MKDLQTYLDDALKYVKLESAPVLPIIEDYDIHAELRELIATTRNSLDVTQNQLAEKSGVSQSNISKIESGNYHPSIATIKKIADALGKRLIIDFIDRDDLE
ncbi:MAG: helix-turn-helix transcriptional regulator [Oscillospiraceae bacterium]|nr:helix-turn-helix transcriptional regulator [Oscillospiraceae bacterium]MCL2250124.1 helix-turn-helix transcriptional regulator [Oscillospiraceae bacterium]